MNTAFPDRDGVGVPDGPGSGQLGRLRWAVRAILTLGVAASVAANVLHARPNLVSQAVAAWSPVALLLTVEMISRVPVHRRALGVLRLAATGGVAGIASWVSYWHLADVAARYGESGATAYLLPLSVDGMVVAATVSLVEITGRIRTAASPSPTPVRSDGRPARPDRAVPAGRQMPAGVARPGGRPASTDTASRPAAAGSPASGIVARQPSRPRPAAAGHQVPVGGDPVGGVGGGGPDTDPADPAARQRSGDRTSGAGPVDGSRDGQLPGDGDGEGDVVPVETAAAVAYWHRKRPDLHPADIAVLIQRSERTVRRHLPPPAGSDRRGTGSPVEAR